MQFFKTLLLGIKRLILSIFGLLRRAICCRKRVHSSEKSPEIVIRSEVVTFQEVSEDEDWNTWEDNKSQSPVNCDTVAINMDQDKLLSDSKEVISSQENDFFKDMVPQFQRPKKLLVKIEENKTSRTPSSRLAMDTSFSSAVGPTLGLLEDLSGNFDSYQETDEFWGTEALIKEMKIAERQKKIAEHQRRKQDKEATRMGKKNIRPIKLSTASVVSTDTMLNTEHYKYT